MDYIVVLMTASSLKEARKIADTLVSKRLAACVNVIPDVTSIYIWRQKKESSKEVLLIAKARARNFSRMKQLVRKIHSYEVPEIIALPILKGDAAYLRWIRGTCKS